MQFSKWTMGVGMLLGTLLPVSAEAQVVKNDKLLSFEDPQIPVLFRERIPVWKSVMNIIKMVCIA